MSPLLAPVVRWARISRCQDYNVLPRATISGTSSVRHRTIVLLSSVRPSRQLAAR